MVTEVREDPAGLPEEDDPAGLHGGNEVVSAGLREEDKVGRQEEDEVGHREEDEVERREEDKVVPPPLTI